MAKEPRSVSKSGDEFMDRYLTGTTMTAGLGKAKGKSRQTAPEDASPRRRRVAPLQTIALGGQILTPKGPIKGWLTIEGGLISAISARKPPGAKAVHRRMKDKVGRRPRTDS